MPIGTRSLTTSVITSCRCVQRCNPRCEVVSGLEIIRKIGLGRQNLGHEIGGRGYPQIRSSGLHLGKEWRRLTPRQLLCCLRTLLNERTRCFYNTVGAIVL